MKLGSIKASYLLIELYYDDDSPYKDLEKTISYAKQLFDATKDPDLAFLLGNIYDQKMKDYMKALNWYETAHRLGHRRVAFYLGRFYYYGVLRTKRDGIKALEYFKEAQAMVFWKQKLISRIFRSLATRICSVLWRHGSVP